MSDDFDREAEKERLREKFEAEEESRQTTEHMSELLLKGATMTNRHCDECGDPIFRYDGQEFCPTCQKPVQDTSGARETETADSKTDQPAETDTSTVAGTQPRQQESPNEAERGNRRPAPSAQREVSTTQDAGETPGSTPQPTAAGNVSGDLDSARTSLLRTLFSLAAEAEKTSDIRRTQDLLSAAREAAEAIAALDRVDR